MAFNVRGPTARPVTQPKKPAEPTRAPAPAQAPAPPPPAGWQARSGGTAPTVTEGSTAQVKRDIANGGTRAALAGLTADFEQRLAQAKANPDPAARRTAINTVMAERHEVFARIGQLEGDLQKTLSMADPGAREARQRELVARAFPDRPQVQAALLQALGSAGSSRGFTPDELAARAAAGRSVGSDPVARAADVDGDGRASGTELATLAKKVSEQLLRSVGTPEAEKLGKLLMSLTMRQAGTTDPALLGQLARRIEAEHSASNKDGRLTPAELNAFIQEKEEALRKGVAKNPRAVEEQVIAMARELLDAMGR